MREKKFFGQGENMKYALFAFVIFWMSACAHETNETAPSPSSTLATQPTVRVATFNVSMYRQEKGQLVTDLGSGEDEQVAAVAKIIRTINPDILLLNEFDHDPAGVALKLFQEKFLYPDNASAAYKYTYVVPSNTGVSSGLDFDKSGEAVTKPGDRFYGGDSFGYGIFEGQYSFAIVSRYPIDFENIRSFQKFLWKDMPGNVLPTDWYDLNAQNVFRLSSKNHVDIPVTIDGKTLHVLAAHPTPPSFDGPEDRNGKRNHDEIRLLADYITPEKSYYLIDDNGNKGGLDRDERFVILGDLNADPNDGDTHNNAIRQLLDHSLVAQSSPSSRGGEMAAKIAGGGNRVHKSPPSQDTADFRDINAEGGNDIGNLRLDYVLPSKNLEIVDSGIFWPAKGDDGYNLVGPGFPPVSSDHRLVWVDVKIK